MMRKFILVLAALLTMTVAANAQAVQKSKTFENIYVTVYGGGTTTSVFADVPAPFFWDGAKSIANGVRPFMGIELGKYITPSVGFSVEGMGNINTTTSYTFFDESAVLANGKLNFSNWLGGYKGQPRVFEIVGVIGAGWGRDYTGHNQTYTSNAAPEDMEVVTGIAGTPTDKNYMVYRAGLEFNFNLGKARAWQINVRPGMMWLNKYNGNYQSLPTFKQDARANVQLGITYKFGSKSKKSHNFVLCPYSRTEEEYHQLLAENDFLKNNPDVVEKEVVKTVTETKEVILKDTRVLVGSTVITFGIGSAALTATERGKVKMFAESLDNDTLVQIVGSADSKTGSESRNFALAQNRANVVKNVLVNDFGISADRINTAIKIDATDQVETSRSAILTLSVE